ncbi:MAG: isochorismatase family protein [Desulfobacterales bacterium]
MNNYSRFINCSEAMLLVVDIQKTMFDLCTDRQRVLKNIGVLIVMGDHLKIPAVFTEHNAGKLGGFDEAMIEKSPGSPVLNKIEFSCFGNGKIREAINNTGKKSIILSGIESHVCIFQTGAQAIEEGYTVHVVADAISARTNENHQIGLNRLGRAGAVITSTEMLIFELLLKAGTPDFKKMLPIIKTL